MIKKITKKTVNTKLVIPKELNHHGTLFAAELTKWFVESSFLCAAKNTKAPETVVCLKINEFILKEPAQNGDILDFESDVVKLGNSSFIVYTSLKRSLTGEVLGYGFITFVTVDGNNKSIKHGLTLYETKDNDIIELRETASKLNNN